MLYWSESIGTSVYAMDKKIGNIEDIMLEPDKKTITGFLLEKRNQDIRSRYFPFAHIKEINRKCICLKETAVIKAFSKDVRRKVILSDDLLNNTIIDEKGDFIGRVVDIAFNPDNGIVKEIILSESIIDDIWLGRKKMPVLGHVEFSQELISINKDTREEITVLNKGLKKWLK
jgi:uncharacterized protein YrrD